MKPDIGGMLLARADFDHAINQVAAILAPLKDGEAIDFDEHAMNLVRSRIAKARDALRRFEEAAHGA